VLQITVDDKTYFALNDVVLQRIRDKDKNSKVLYLSAYIDGNLVDNYAADGIIFSTPTGSTAYSLSAGGSILMPDINGFSITPICAHTMYSRPIIYSDKSNVTVKIDKDDDEVTLFCDGRPCGDIFRKNNITLKRADFDIRFVINNESDNFLKKLLLKLSRNG
jgi:NAD+ kinase